MASLIKRILPAQMHFFSSDDLEEATFMLYLWVMELLPSAKFEAHLTSYRKRSGSKMRNSREVRKVLSEARTDLFNNFDATRLKLATFKALFFNLTDRIDLERLFVGEDLPADCADLYLYLLKDPIYWRTLKDKLKTFTDPILMNDLIVDPDRLIDQCNEDFKQYRLNGYICSEVRRKLWFIAVSNNTTLDEFEQEIKMRAVSYYYKVRPFKGRLYASNYARKSIYGGVNQIIYKHTKEEYARLKEESGKWKDAGYQGVVFSLSDPKIMEAVDRHYIESAAA